MYIEEQQATGSWNKLLFWKLNGDMSCDILWALMWITEEGNKE
jgi:hypothetical protein